MREEPHLEHIVPNTPEEATEAPTLYREGTDYYRTPRAQHRRHPHRPLRQG
ncbi:hypothetical protein [Streptomyces avermitilis]|uniref:hypothetical protein n=1 Tax=Streptomyces avermitilis TaxID=33903 RepID=UPI0033BB2DC2